MKKTNQGIPSILFHRLTIPFTLLLIVFILYSGTFELGFFSDDFEGISRYKKWGLGGLGDNYGNVFFMPFSFIFQTLELQILSHYTFIKIINLLLFGGTSIFLFSIARRLFSRAQNGQFVAAIVAMIFICSPYQTEAINWFSSQAYVLATFFSVWALWVLVREKQNNWTPFYFNFLLLIALLNKEIALAVPFIATTLLFLQNGKTNSILKKSLIGSMFVLALYFGLRWITLGTLIGGYGDAVHTNLDPGILLNGLAAYFAKFFGFYRYLPPGINKAAAIILMTLTGTAILVLHNSLPYRKKLSFVLLVCFVLSIFPVMNLETSFLDNIQSDRYGYFPSVFFSLFIGSVLLHLENLGRTIFFTFWISFSTVFLFYTQSKWLIAARIRNQFVGSLRSLEIQEFYLMNLPDNCDGVYIFRHGLEELIGQEYTVHSLSRQHLGFDGPTQWYDAKNNTIVLMSSSRFEVCEPIIGQQSSNWEGRAFLSIHKDSIGGIPIMYFDPEKGKIYACSTE